MYKLIILISPEAEGPAFDDQWPQFLHQAESMPGLLREATIRVQHSLYGDLAASMLHELFFESQDALYKALASPQGQAAGQILQRITDGYVTLLVAEHKEDQIENLRKYRQPEAEDADAG